MEKFTIEYGIKIAKESIDNGIEATFYAAGYSRALSETQVTEVVIETGKTPRQLADLNKELLYALKAFLSAQNSTQGDRRSRLVSAANQAQDAIKKATI